MAFRETFGPTPVATTTTTVGGAVPTGQVWRIIALKIEQPSTGDAKTIRWSRNGTAATATNIIDTLQLPAGEASKSDVPNIMMIATHQFQCIAAVGTTAQANITITVEKELSA